MLKEEVKQVIHVIYGNGSDKDKEAVDSITSATWNAISEALTDQIVAMGVLTWEGQSFIMHKTEEAPTIDYGISGFGKRKDGDKEVTYTFTIRVEGGFPGLVLGLLISCFLGWCYYRCIRLFNTLLNAFYKQLPTSNDARFKVYISCSSVQSYYPPFMQLLVELFWIGINHLVVFSST